MRNLLLAFAVLATSLWIASGVHAQSAVVVSSCGTPPATYSAGFTRAVTQDTAGLTCTSASASGTFTDDATGTTGNPVPGSAAYDGVNFGGNLVGQTGVNPSGSIFAAQVDIASVGGVTLLRGNGVTGTGSQRVTIASDNTPFHIIVDTAPSTAVTNAGTFAIQCALCSTAAKQPALGTAGTPSADVITVQGAATGTPLPTVTGGNSYTNITTATTTTPKSGGGVLHTICVNALGTVASSATVYDNTAGSGTKIATLNTLALLGCQTYDVTFATGLTIVTTGTVAPDLTASWR
jgi:hypothetical protein